MSQAKTLELAQTPLNTTQAVASSSTLTTLERQAIEDKATKMNMSVVWTAAKLLVGWRGNTTYFPAGARICGIPYSQTVNWCDDIQFNAALNYSDFYDSYSRDSIVMPKYGLDCSGFVSKAWGEGRQTTLDFVNQIKSGARPKVGIYDPNNLTQANLLNSYKSLQQGDAVVYRSGSDGHAFEISFNDGTGVYCNEETVPQTAYSYWTYAQLAANSYMPFSKK